MKEKTLEAMAEDGWIDAEGEPWHSVGAHSYVEFAHWWTRLEARLLKGKDLREEVIEGRTRYFITMEAYDELARESTAKALEQVFKERDERQFAYADGDYNELEHNR